MQYAIVAKTFQRLGIALVILPFFKRVCSSAWTSSASIRKVGEKVNDVNVSAWHLHPT